MKSKTKNMQVHAIRLTTMQRKHIEAKASLIGVIPTVYLRMLIEADMKSPLVLSR